MELIEDEEKSKVYQDGNITYNMLDMGSYVGHNSREWYEVGPENWYLMSMDEKTEESNTHIESLVDDRGNYTRFIMEKDNIKRVLLLVNNLVYSDSVMDKTTADRLGLGDLYYALKGDIYSKEKYPLIEYIQNPKEFDLQGKTLSGEIPSLDYLAKYLNVNQLLKQELEDSKPMSM